jgi:hypothetical protein
MPVGVFMALCNRKTAGNPSYLRESLTPARTRPSDSNLEGLDNTPMRFVFAESLDPPRVTMEPTQSAHGKTDLEMVEELLDRCWREVDASELNVKMADIVRLLEFKNKLRNTAEAEQTFWALIDRIRGEELAEFGLVSAPGLNQESDRITHP